MEQSGTQVVSCTGCGAKNRIPANKIGVAAKCGKCGSPLKVDQKKADETGSYVFRCTECGARNKIPSSRVNTGPKCGKCHTPLKTEELFVAQPIMVSDGNFESMVLKSPLPVLLFAWAPWCPTCRAAMPAIDDFGRESKGKVRVGKVNVDNSPMLSSKYNIMSVPTMFIFDNGQLKESMPGAMQKHEILMKMAPYL